MENTWNDEKSISEINKKLMQNDMKAGKTENLNLNREESKDT
jgi:hypothetical protein